MFGHFILIFFSDFISIINIQYKILMKWSTKGRVRVAKGWV
jgi:hypothetical protein